MTVRVLYVMLVRLTGWIALLARSATSKDAELLVLRWEGTALRWQNPRPRLDWANRMVIVALAPTLPRPLRMSRLMTPGAMLCRNQSLTAQMRAPNIVRQPSV